MACGGGSKSVRSNHSTNGSSKLERNGHSKEDLLENANHHDDCAAACMATGGLLNGTAFDPCPKSGDGKLFARFVAPGTFQSGEVSYDACAF